MEHGERGDNEVGARELALVLEEGQKGESLHGLAQAHLVPENAPQAAVVVGYQPLHPG